MSWWCDVAILLTVRRAGVEHAALTTYYDIPPPHLWAWYSSLLPLIPTYTGPPYRDCSWSVDEPGSRGVRLRTVQYRRRRYSPFVFRHTYYLPTARILGAYCTGIIRCDCSTPPQLTDVTHLPFVRAGACYVSGCITAARLVTRHWCNF